jgi:ATP-dependent Lon protease
MIMDEIDKKLNDYYAGKVVRKDLTKSIKEGANVPSYVLRVSSWHVLCHR